MNIQEIEKLVRKARKLEFIAADEKTDSRIARKSESRQREIENTILGLLVDPHAASNASIEVTRCEQLLARKSTNSRNRSKRQRMLREAKMQFSRVSVDLNIMKTDAKDVLDVMMGRKTLAPGALPTE